MIKSMQRTQPKTIAPSETLDLQIVGQKFDEQRSLNNNYNNKKGVQQDNQRKSNNRQSQIQVAINSSGGYKIPEKILNKSKKIESQKNHIDEKASKYEIMRNLGIDNRQQMKENLLDLENFDKGTHQNRFDLADTLVSQIDKKLQKIQYQREKINEKLMKNYQSQDYIDSDLIQNQEQPEYEIPLSNLPDKKFQSIYHNLNSNEIESTENVESLLNAHRNQLREVELNYMQKLKEKRHELHKQLGFPIKNPIMVKDYEGYEQLDDDEEDQVKNKNKMDELFVKEKEKEKQQEIPLEERLYQMEQYYLTPITDIPPKQNELPSDQEIDEMIRQAGKKLKNNQDQNKKKSIEKPLQQIHPLEEKILEVRAPQALKSLKKEYFLVPSVHDNKILQSVSEKMKDKENRKIRVISVKDIDDYDTNDQNTEAYNPTGSYHKSYQHKNPYVVALPKKENPKNFERRFDDYKRKKQNQQVSKQIQNFITKPDFDLASSTSPAKNKQERQRREQEYELGLDRKGQKTWGSQNEQDLIDQTIQQNFESQNKIKQKKEPSVDIKKVRESKKLSESQKKKYEATQILKRDERKLIEFFFEKMDPHNRGYVSKVETIRFLNENQKIMELYDLQPTRIEKDLNRFKTLDPFSLNSEEFYNFLKKSSQQSDNEHRFSSHSHSPLQRSHSPQQKSQSSLQNSQYPQQQSYSRLQNYSQSPQQTINLKDQKSKKKKQNFLEHSYDSQNSQRSYNSLENKKYTESKVNFNEDQDQEEPKSRKKQLKKPQSTPLLKQEQIELMKQIFQKLDSYGDLVLKRSYLIQNLQNDKQIRQMLNQPAIYNSSTNQSINLGTLLNQIEQDQYNPIDQSKIISSKEYISWSQFMQYVNNYNQVMDKNSAGISQLSKNTLNQSVNDDQDQLDLPETILQYLHDKFDQYPKNVLGFLKTQDFIKSLINEPQFERYQEENARQKAELFDLKPENLNQAISRIYYEGPQYLNWNQFIQFFTRRGTIKLEENSNIDLKKKQQQEDLIKKFDNNKNILKKRHSDELDNRSLQKSVDINKYQEDNFYLEQPQGYDSDPQYRDISNRSYQLIKMQKSNLSDGDDVQNQYDSFYPQQRLRHRNSDVGINYEKYEKEYFEEQENQNKNKKKYTIPVPFQFDERENSKEKSIRQKKLEEMLYTKDLKENLIKNQLFRAKEIPRSTTEPLYQKIIEENQKRRTEVKQNSITMTLANQRPFSFYERDKEKAKTRKKNQWEREQYQFMSKPIPWYCKTNLLDQLNLIQQERREERVRQYRELSASRSRMPPRMEMHELQKQEQKRLQELEEKERFKVKQFKRKPVPNFDKLHSTFQQLLDSKKLSKQPTIPKPFNFEENKKAIPREYMDQDNELIKKTIEKPKKKDFFNSQPKIQPPATKKWEAQLKLVKQQNLEKKKQEEAKKKEEETRLQKQKQFAPRLQQSTAIVDNKKKLEEEKKQKLKQYKQDMKDKEQKYNEKLKEINQKVQNRPLLVEQSYKKDEHLERMKNIVKFAKILRNSGVKNPKFMLSKEEQELLDDYEYLKKQGYDLDEQDNEDKQKQKQNNSNDNKINNNKSSSLKKPSIFNNDTLKNNEDNKYMDTNQQKDKSSPMSQKEMDNISNFFDMQSSKKSIQSPKSNFNKNQFGQQSQQKAQQNDQNNGNDDDYVEEAFENIEDDD